MRRLLLALLTGFVLMAWFPASAKETVQQRIDALMVTTTLVMPEGKGPFPVVIQMHGCGGRKPFQDDWAQVAKDAGWAVLVVDSYAHRRISTLEAFATVCTGMRLWGRERAGDMYAMMEWVRHQSWADANRIAVAGWSHGGWTALDAMVLTPGAEMASATHLEDLPAEPLAGLVGAFIVYPYVGPGCIAPGRGLRVDVPVQALIGTNDVVVGGKMSIGLLKRTATKGQPIEVVPLDGATHAFDEPSARDLRVRYDPELTARAHGYYTDFLKALAKKTSTIH